MGLGQSAEVPGEDDFRELQPAYLDKFIAEQLQPDEKFLTLIRTALGDLDLYLRKNMRTRTIKKLIKGGSIGKGTALRGRSDLDCVLVMNGIRDARELREKISWILDQLKKLLHRNPLRRRGWGIGIIRDNKFMVQIEMHNFQRNESVEVDILPTFDAAMKNEYSPNKLYQSMTAYDSDTRDYCSAALAMLQLDFIKQRPTKLKSLIRLVKHWCKTYLPWEFGQPRMSNSYLLELLTIHVWEKAGSQSCFDTALLFKDVMVALYNHRQLDIKWEKYYSKTWIQFQKPYIMDPANPFNNLYDVVGDWQKVKRIARETLDKPLLQSYSSTFLDTKNSGSTKYYKIVLFIILCICLFLLYYIP